MVGKGLVIGTWISSALLLTAGLVVGGASAGDAGPAPGTRAAPNTRLVRDVDGPAARARATGKRVAVDADTTPTRRTWVNPDGTNTTEMYPQPVRARVGGSWVPIDTALRQRDAAVTPAATGDPVVFSAGGDGPLVRLGAPGRAFELRWPDRLPAPVLSGDTATYPSVFPGVDLVLRATRQGYAQTLVVRDRQAAARPEVRDLRFDVVTDGTSIRLARDGTLQVVDATGAVAWTSPAPAVWDASGRAGAAPVTPAARSAVGRFRLDGGVLRVVAPTDFLDDPATVYPVTIDPDFGAPQVGWAEVYAQHPNQSYWGGDGDNVAKVGYSNWSSPAVTVRSYYQFNLSFLFDRQIVGAEFNDRENWSPSCQARPVELHETGAIGPGTTWNNQPWIGQVLGSPQNVAHGHDAGCPPEPVGFDAKVAVVNSVNSHYPTTALMLKAIDEGDPYAWKKFDSNPSLVVTYNSFPDVPKDPYADVPLNPHLACSQTPDAVVSNATTGLRAHVAVTDPDGGSVNALFRWFNWDTNADLGYSGWLPPQNSGSGFTATMPDSLLTDGARLGWQVLGGDGVAASKGWSTPCEVTIDRTRPGPATVSSDVYVGYDPATQDGTVSGGIGRTGRFTFRPGADPDVVAFSYSTTDNPTPRTVPMDPASRSAVVGISPSRQGPMDVTVRAVDRAGNQSAAATAFHMFVGAGSPPAGYWRLDGTGTESAAPELTGRHPGTMAGSAGWTTGRVGDAALFDGTAGYLTTTGGAAVHTDSSFSVSAWVKLGTTGAANQTAVSQDSTGTVSGFQLGYRGDVNRFGFVVPGTDHTISGGDIVTASTAPVVGEWTQLVGEFDSGAKQLRLYVNGVLAGTVSHTAAWDATGPVQIGRSISSGAPTNYWHGAVDEVKIYDRLLSAVDNDDHGRTVSSEVHSLATGPVSELGFWPLDDGAGTVAADVSGAYRAGTVGTGVSWAPGAVGSGAAQFTGTATGIDTGGPAVRGDQSFSVSVRVAPGAAIGIGTHTVLSQDGTAAYASDFALSYTGQSHTWTFGVNGAGSVSATAQLHQDEWSAVTAVYDAPARQLRLYLDGALAARTTVGSAAAMAGTGTLVIGRGRSGTDPTAGWLGRVDDVHVYLGVLSDGSPSSDASVWPDDRFPANRIAFELNHPRTGPDTPYAGQFSVLIGQAAQRIVTTGAIPPGYHLERGLGFAAAPGTPGTHPLYSCRAGAADWFLSLRDDCEGQRALGPVGAVYDSAPAGIASRPLYRCHNTVEHTAANVADCGGPGWTTESLLGYTVDRGTLVRYATPTVPAEDASDTGPVPGAYRVTGPLGVVGAVTDPGTTPLLSCLRGTDRFLSVRADCEGATVLGVTGAAWTADPGGGAALYRCRNTASGDLFATTDQTCAGQTPDTVLGYLRTGA